jgi:hypothetical protein
MNELLLFTVGNGMVLYKDPGQKNGVPKMDVNYIQGFSGGKD